MQVGRFVETVKELDRRHKGIREAQGRMRSHATSLKPENAEEQYEINIITGYEATAVIDELVISDEGLSSIHNHIMNILEHEAVEAYKYLEKLANGGK